MVQIQTYFVSNFPIFGNIRTSGLHFAFNLNTKKGGTKKSAYLDTFLGIEQLMKTTGLYKSIRSYRFKFHSLFLWVHNRECFPRSIFKASRGYFFLSTTPCDTNNNKISEAYGSIIKSMPLLVSLVSKVTL